MNFGVQAGGFSIVAFGMLDVLKHLPFRFKERTGLVNQLHDAVLFTVKEQDAVWARDVITAHLTRRVPELAVTFTAEAHIGERWSTV